MFSIEIEYSCDMVSNLVQISKKIKKFFPLFQEKDPLLVERRQPLQSNKGGTCHARNHPHSTIGSARKPNEPTHDYSTDPRITQVTQARRNGNVVYRLRFNPNSHRQQSHETGETLTWGTCFTMSDYRKMLAQWEDKASLSPDDVQHIRVDFCIDCTNEEQAASFKKYCDLMIACFKSKHRISEKHDYYGATQMTLRPKSNKAKHGEYELELYCKSIQQEKNGAEWRMEIRHMEGSCKRRKLLAPEERLRRMQEE